MEFMAKKWVPYSGFEWFTELVSFEQRDVLRVVKALASYRPSLIALQ